MPRQRRIKRRRPSAAQCEFLETRRLLTALMVNDTNAVDTITLGVTPAGSISVVLNGVETDYKASNYDSVIVSTSTANDLVNVQATVLPTTVHYAAAATVIVGDGSGVQDIKAALNMNGVIGGPIANATANIALNDTGDVISRTVSMTTNGDQEIIAGLAPAQILIGVVAHPLAAAAPGAPVGQETLALTSGAGADGITLSSLRGSLVTTFYNAGGNDAINIGNGSLAQIYSSVSVWGRTNQLDVGFSSLKVDDSTDATAAQFALSAIYPPGPGAIVYVDFQGNALPTQRISVRVAEVSLTTIDGGSGGNQFTVNALPARPASDGVLTLNAGGGKDTMTLNATAAGTLVDANGQGGDDAMVIGSMGPFAPSGVNGNVNVDGGTGVDSLTVFGPQTNPLDIPTVPVIVTAGLLEHHDLTIHYANLDTLQLEHGNYQVNADLGLIALSIASEKSDISFESSTEVTFNTTQHLAALNISAGAVSLAAGGGCVINTTSLGITGGTLDLADGSLQVHYSGGVTPFPSIRSSVFSKQIFTSSADSHHNLGYADSADNIVPNLAANTVLVTYAIYGDANLDRSVGFEDLVALAQHYGQSSKANWDQGDFNYDSAVGFEDLVLLAQNYGSSFPITLAIASAAPTPAAALIASAPAPRPVVSKPIVAPRRPARR